MSARKKQAIVLPQYTCFEWDQHHRDPKLCRFDAGFKWNRYVRLTEIRAGFGGKAFNLRKKVIELPCPAPEQMDKPREHSFHHQVNRPE